MVGWVIGTGFGVGFLLSNKIILVCLKLFNFTGVNVVMTSPAQLINLQLYTALLVAIIVAIPILIGEIVQFVSPALKQKERRWLGWVLPISAALFLTGSLFGGWVTQFIVSIYARYSHEFRVSNIWDIQNFFQQVVMTAILMGAIFQLPLLMSGVIRSRLVSVEVFRQNRRYFYAILILITVLLPPTDILSLILLTTPLLFLYEIGLLFNVGVA